MTSMRQVVVHKAVVAFHSWPEAYRLEDVQSLICKDRQYSVDTAVNLLLPDLYNKGPKQIDFCQLAQSDGFIQMVDFWQRLILL